MTERTPTPPVFDPDLIRQVRALRQVIDQILNGKLNSTGTVTLTANATATTLVDRRLGVNSQVLFAPTTATASVDFKDVYISSKDKEKAIITHPSTADTDKIFGYTIIG